MRVRDIAAAIRQFKASRAAGNSTLLLGIGCDARAAKWDVGYGKDAEATLRQAGWAHDVVRRVEPTDDHNRLANEIVAILRKRCGLELQVDGSVMRIGLPLTINELADFLYKLQRKGKGVDGSISVVIGCDDRCRYWDHRLGPDVSVMYREGWCRHAVVRQVSADTHCGMLAEEIVAAFRSQCG